MAPLPGSGMTVWTEPLPKVRCPRITARWWSCNAPATISLAEALPPLVSTTTGRPPVMSPGLAFQRWLLVGVAGAGGHDLPLLDEVVGHG